MTRHTIAASIVILSIVAATQSVPASDWAALDRATAGARWPHPELNDSNYQRWIEFIQPTEKDLEWQKVRWHMELADAQEEARRLMRPILLWTMNGHPCGET